MQRTGGKGYHHVKDRMVTAADCNNKEETWISGKWGSGHLQRNTTYSNSRLPISTSWVLETMKILQISHRKGFQHRPRYPNQQANVKAKIVKTCQDVQKLKKFTAVIL